MNQGLLAVIIPPVHTGLSEITAKHPSCVSDRGKHPDVTCIRGPELDLMLQLHGMSLNHSATSSHQESIISK